MPAMWLFILLACTPTPEVDLPTEGSFRALTYNVAGLPDALSSADKPGAERMPQIAALLGDFDFVGLQEDFVAENHELLVDTEHETEEWFDAVRTDIEPAPAMGSGLSVLAREFQVTDYFEEHYTECHGVLDGASDCLGSKGFQVLRVSLGGHELDIYNTHHEAGGGAEDDAARNTQREQVIASIGGRSDGRAILFMGDTNMRWTDPEDAVDLQAYKDIGLVDACDMTSCVEPDHIDRFLMRDSAELTLVATEWWRDERFVDAEGEDLSDHPAIGAVIGWAVAQP